MGSVIGMTKDAVSPVVSQTAQTVQQAASVTGWDCACGQKNIMSKFCPECGSKKPEPVAPAGWNCACGACNITGKFCPECGAKKPTPVTWDCACGNCGITAKFCPECGTKRPE